jgi:hypothetical protein
MFQLTQKLTLNVQVGPFDTFEELQAAAAREIPGAVVIADNPRQNAHAGQVKDSSGNVIAQWSMPFSFIRPVSFTRIVGPVDTYEELEAAAAKEIPGTKLVHANPKAKDAHSGDVTDSRGNVTGKWTEGK